MTTTTDDIREGTTPGRVLGMVLAGLPGLAVQLALLAYFFGVLTSEVDSLKADVDKLTPLDSRVSAIEERISAQSANVERFWSRDWPEMRQRLESMDERQRVLQVQMQRLLTAMERER